MQLSLINRSLAILLLMGFVVSSRVSFKRYILFRERYSICLLRSAISCVKTCWNSFSRTTWIDRCGFKVPDSFGTACTCVHWVCISVILYILRNKYMLRANAHVCMNCVLQRLVAIATRDTSLFNPLALSPLTTKKYYRACCATKFIDFQIKFQKLNKILFPK